jgi:hypothetical protein
VVSIAERCRIQNFDNDSIVMNAKR